MKAIMISIKPQYVAKILNGEKTIEIRKSIPKCDLPIDVYICCTKDKDTLLTYQPHYPRFICSNQSVYVDRKKAVANSYNGKVVAKFTLNKVEEIKPSENFWFDNKNGANPCYYCQNDILEDVGTLHKNSCLCGEDMFEYLKGKKGYAWHIDNLVIFDRPKELREFKHCTEKTCIYGKCHKYMHCLKSLTKAPQNFCYMEVK